MSLPRSRCRLAAFTTGLLALLALTAPGALAQDKKPFARWEKAIAAFEAQDRTSPPPRHAVVFVGSSTIRLWKLSKSFPDLRTINRGFGGSQLADAVHFGPRIVTKYAPRVVVLYSGDNDINAGKTPAQVLADFNAFVKLVQAALPGTKIIVLAVKPSPSRLKHLAAQRQANALIAARCKEDKRLVFVDVAKPMLGRDGQPRPELFLADRLHMNEQGYKLWTVLLAPILKELAPTGKEGKQGAGQTARPAIVGHRGLLRDAPENTLAGFAACLELGLGFELDVRRTRDGHLVCLHDADVRRTTNGKGAVGDFTLAELRRLDAGSWFDRAFAGQRVPTLEEVFALLKERGRAGVLVALDIKVEGVEADLIRLAAKYGVLERVVCIGLTITDPAVRRRLRQANPAAPTAALAKAPDALSAVLADPDAAWVYVRFVPTAAQVAAAHRTGKRVFLSGPAISGDEPENWRRARAAGVDALLTDFPLTCRQSWRSASPAQKRDGRP